MGLEIKLRTTPKRVAIVQCDRSARLYNRQHLQYCEAHRDFCHQFAICVVMLLAQYFLNFHYIFQIFCPHMRHFYYFSKDFRENWWHFAKNHNFQIVLFRCRWRTNRFSHCLRRMRNFWPTIHFVVDSCQPPQNHYYSLILTPFLKTKHNENCQYLNYNFLFIFVNYSLCKLFIVYVFLVINWYTFANNSSFCFILSFVFAFYYFRRWTVLHSITKISEW